MRKLSLLHLTQSHTQYLEDSNLAKRIQSSKMGIIFHTSYTGRKMSNLKDKFGVNVRSFSKTNSVF